MGRIDGTRAPGHSIAIAGEIQGMIFLEAGQTVKAGYAIKYLKVCDDVDDYAGNQSPYEGLELVLKDGRSVLMSNWTDWTLKITQGGWPVLPKWSWPPEDWAYEIISKLGTPGFDEIFSVSEIFDDIEFIGLILQFAEGTLTVRSTNALEWAVVHNL